MSLNLIQLIHKCLFFQRFSAFSISQEHLKLKNRFREGEYSPKLHFPFKIAKTQIVNFYQLIRQIISSKNTQISYKNALISVAFSHIR